MKVTKAVKIQFEDILENQKIYPVFQPIVSLKDGSVYGYEALTRIDLEESIFNIEEMFQIAVKLNKIWELETMCRAKILRKAIKKPENCKLFINVDPNVIEDKEFQSGVTKRRLRKYNLDSADIVFEITERSAIKREKIFKETIMHYKNSDYEIAVDDFGSEYAGLNRICIITPQYIKMDKKVIKNIDKDKLKYSLVKNFLGFCLENDIMMIAEGIETKEEYDVPVELGVHLGQGYYLAHPNKEFIQ